MPSYGIRLCEHCGKFYDARRDNQRYCSGKCNPTIRTPVTLTCQHCHALFDSVSPKQRFCCHTCRAYGSHQEKPRKHGGYKAMTINGKWTLEHRHIMEQQLGRPLGKHEHVHHIDGDRQNNTPSNLRVIDQHLHIHEHKPWIASSAARRAPAPPENAETPA